MKVLYVSHTGQLGGGERSLLELIGALPQAIAAAAATPPGRLHAALTDLGVPTATLTGTAGSLRLHPVHTPRAALQVASSGWQVRRAAALHGAELVHANSIRAGAMLALAPLPGVARVVHVRDCLPSSPITAATMRLIARSADVVVANSRYTGAWVASVAPRAQVEVVHNGVELDRWGPAGSERAAVRAAIDGAAASGLLLGVVAQLTPWKGQDTAIRALALLREEGIDAHLALVGSAKFRDPATRFDNERYVADLHELVRELGLREHVSFLGEREDVAQLMAALDVLLVPSWQEPFGRSVIEAMAAGVPVVATDVGGPSEVITDGVEGLLVSPRTPPRWADAIRRLAQDEGLARSLARAARERVERSFTAASHAARMVEIYERALASASRGRPTAASRG